eukprot:5341318-Pyramimonas_sp.AAC.1
MAPDASKMAQEGRKGSPGISWVVLEPRVGTGGPQRPLPSEPSQPNRIPRRPKRAPKTALNCPKRAPRLPREAPQTSTAVAARPKAP